MLQWKLKKSVHLRAYTIAASVAHYLTEVHARASHRVLVTEYSEDLLESSAIHEFRIIDTMRATNDPEKLDDIISREWLAGTLRTRQPYLARINADGSVTVREIVE